MKVIIKTVFLAAICTLSFSLVGMEDVGQKQQLIYRFNNINQEAWKHYALIMSFIEAALSGCRFTINDDNKICFNDIYSKKKYRVSLKELYDINQSTEAPQCSNVNSLFDPTKNPKICKDFKNLSHQQQSILLQTWRWNSFCQFQLANQIFTQERFAGYIKNNDSQILNQLLDGFDITQKDNQDYLDSYLNKLIQRNNNRKAFFIMQEKLFKMLIVNQNIIFGEEERSIFNKPLFIQFTPLAQQHKNILNSIEKTEKDKCILS